jgi:hypothetical protein
MLHGVSMDAGTGKTSLKSVSIIHTLISEFFPSLGRQSANKHL